VYKAEVRVGFRPGVADPEGDNTRKALVLLGFDHVKEVRAARVYDILVDARSADEAKAKAEAMCARLLANPVVHDFTIEVAPIG